MVRTLPLFISKRAFANRRGSFDRGTDKYCERVYGTEGLISFKAFGKSNENCGRPAVVFVAERIKDGQLIYIFGLSRVKLQAIRSYKRPSTIPAVYDSQMKKAKKC